MADAFLTAQLTAIEAQITAYNAAILALATGGVESYTLDTGQSRQTVTKLNLDSLNNVVDGLLNQRAVIRARCTGNGVLIGRPGY